MTNVAVLISGGGSNMVSLLDSMQSGLGTPVVVVSNIATAGGLQKAQNRGVPTEVVDHTDFEDRPEFEAKLQDVLNAYKVDVVCLAGFMRVLTAGFVDQWTNRMLNIHPSLLPKYKGLNTHARAIQAGDAQAGCSVHLVTPDLDDGPILGQASVPIKQGDTPATLAARVLVEEHRLYPQVLQDFLRKIPV